MKSTGDESMAKGAALAALLLGMLAASGCRRFAA